MKIVKKLAAVKYKGKVYEFEVNVPVYTSPEDIVKHMDEDEFLRIFNYSVDIRERAKARSAFMTALSGEDKALAKLKKAQDALAQLRKTKVKEVK